MPSRKEFTFPSRDGVHQVHAVEWLPDGQPRAVFQMVHGICEYILRYDPFAQFLASHGFVVVGHDHLGHGLTVKDPSEYGYFTDWRHIVEDVHTLHTLTAEQYPGLPYFLMGHSMGSFVVRTYLIDHPGNLAGCLISGTGQESPINVAAGKFLTGLGDPHKVNKLFYNLSIGAYNKKFAPTRTPADWICRDERVVDAYLADPQCNFKTTAGMNHAMMSGLQYVADKANLAKMDKDLPVYFFAGDADPVGAMGKGVEKVARWFRQAGMKDVAVKLYPGGRHEMLNELNKAEVFADNLAFLENVLAR